MKKYINGRKRVIRALGTSKGFTDRKQQANLETQIIGQFNERANQANLQVQDIAIKAIGGASRQRYFQL